MTIDWTQVGTVIGVVLSGAIGWFTGKGRRDVSSAQDGAQISEYRADSTINDAAVAQIKALLDRVELLETKYTKIWDDLQAEKQITAKSRERIRELEGVLRANSITVPPEAP